MIKSSLKIYINGKWEDSNKLYKEYMSWENRKFFVQEIKDFDRTTIKKDERDMELSRHKT